MHIHPSGDGAQWVVDLSDGRSPLSRHRTAIEAELAARRHASRCGARRIFLHDAYHRVRPVGGQRAA